MHRAVVVDVDLRAGLVLDAADRLAAWADDRADLLLVDLDRLDARRVRREVVVRLRQRLKHLVHDEHPALFGLAHRLRQDLHRQALDLDVHLQSRDAIRRPCDLEVHVAHGILDALDVGEDRVAVGGLAALGDQPHRHAGDRRLDRHASVHQARACCRRSSPSRSSHSS